MDDNRVLIRKGARELTEEESSSVTGAARMTATKCTFDPATGFKDGDTGEC